MQRQLFTLMIASSDFPGDQQMFKNRVKNAALKSTSHRLYLAILVLAALAIAGCTTMPIAESGALTSYNQLSPAKGNLGKKRRFFADNQHLAKVRTVRIIPTSFSPIAMSKVTAEANRSLVANAMDRALCVALSDKYQMMPSDQPADLTVRSVVTDLAPTNKEIAAAATVVSVGGGFAMPNDIPLIGIPRLPFGLGGLSVEAEALDISNGQSAAMMWSRGANFLQDKPRYSEVGDAYGLSTKFASDFSKMLITGKEPKLLDLSWPSRARVKSWLGGKPKYEACEAFGRAPGLFGKVSSTYGLPPEWADKGRARAPAR